MKNRLFLWASLTAVFLFPSGCSLFSGSSESPIYGYLGKLTQVELETIEFSAALDANKNSATRIHLVLLHDPFLILEFIKMPAPLYFKMSAQLERDHPQTLEIHSFEISPGDTAGPTRIRYSKAPVAAFLFASYKTPGDHRIRIGKVKDIYVMLDKNDWKILPGKAP